MLIGIIAGCFDVIHPGYIKMFMESKKHCDRLVVALQTDPTIERNNKIKPVLSWDERRDILLSIRYIDEVVKYTTEEDLLNVLKTRRYNVRILGDDYVGKSATGQEFSNKTIYVERNHGWSSTKYKRLIADSLKGK